MWRWLILAYPPEFRSEYGRELLQALGDRYLELRGSARFWFCLEAAADVVVTGSRERYLIMLQDFTYSVRRFAAHPGVSAIAVFSLALGIGANATVTIFGLSYSVTDRFQEIGIRLSLGATRSNIVWMVLSSCMKISAAGLVAGIAGALAATRLLETLLFNVKPWDPSTFVIVTLFLLFVAVTATALPALKATRVDALVAIRRD